MLADVRYALRTFAKRPSFAIAAIAILALGIAANTIAFSLLNSLALRPMPVPHAGRVVRVYPEFDGGRAGNLFSYADVADYRAETSAVFDTLAAYIPAEVTAGRSSLDRAPAPPRAALAYVAASSYFEVTGVAAVLGRVLQPSDDEPDARAVVLSHAFWQRRFAGDRAVLGATIALNAQTFTIVGVAAPGFAGTEPLVADLWMPVAAVSIARHGQGGFRDREWGNFLVLGRLRPGVSRARAESALDVVARRLSSAYPGRPRPQGVSLASGTFFTLDPDVKPIVAGTLAIVGLVLLIACGNVANLLLARAVSRRREIAVRLAIGAARIRIVRQLIVEALMLSVAAGALALLLSTWALRVLYTVGVSLMPFTWTIALTLAPDVRVFAYTLALAIAGGLVFGLAPALQAASPDIVRALHDAQSIGKMRATGARLRNGLVVLQVAGSLVLLMAAGLLLRGLQSAEALDLGFTARGVVFAEYDLNAAGYSPVRAAAFNRALAERIAIAPGVMQTAFTSHVPLHGGVRRVTVRLADRAADQVTTTTTLVSPAYFDVLGLRFVAGRNFSAADAATPAVVISDGLARRFWPGQVALGKVLTSAEWPAPRIVIGVVRDAANAALWRDKEMSLYLPFDATRDPREITAAIVRVSGDTSAVRSVIESTAASLDPDLRVSASPLDDLLRLWLLPSRIAAAAAATLAILALGLASFGLYAVLAFAVSHRLREIGIRMALGATSRDVASLVLAEASRLVATGLLVGGACAAATAPLLGRLLFGVSTFDPLTLAGVSIVLGLVAVAASYLPARRATNLAPLSVLRVD